MQTSQAVCNLKNQVLYRSVLVSAVMVMRNEELIKPVIIEAQINLGSV